MKVQVVLSCYNGERHLQEQLDSIRRQRGVEVALTVRDDGSSDCTLQLIDRFRRDHPALGVALHRGEHLGPSGSFMAALAAAGEADFYAFSDQDDVWHPDKLSRAVSKLDGVEGPALYYSNVNYVDSRLRALGRSDLKSAQALQQVLFENAARGCTMVFNRAARQLAVDAAPPDRAPWMMHDWWLNLLVTALGVTIFDSEACIDYRQHGRNAVGGGSGRLAEAAGKTRFFARNGLAGYRPGRQAGAVLDRYGDRLTAADRAALERLCDRGLLPRCALALGPDVRRRRWLDRQIVRLLILCNLY